MPPIVVLAACAASAQTGPAAPQSQQDMMKMVRLAAHNQLGVMQYCQSKGSVDADTVVLQRRLVGMLPPGSTAGLEEAEAAGKRGLVQFGGNQVSLTDAARAQKTTPDAMCKQIGALLKAQAAQLPQ